MLGAQSERPAERRVLVTLVSASVWTLADEDGLRSACRLRFASSAKGQPREAEAEQRERAGFGDRLAEFDPFR